MYYKNNKILFQEVIKKETIQTLIEKIRNNPHISDYYLNTAYENTKDINVIANGFLGVPIDRDESQKFIDELPEIDENIKGYLSHKWINIISKNASKSRAIKKIIEIKKPKFLLMENVKNLVGKIFRGHFDAWCEYLEELGYTNYHNDYKCLNAQDFNIPQRRERTFMVSIIFSHSYNSPLLVCPLSIPSCLPLTDISVQGKE